MGRTGLLVVGGGIAGLATAWHLAQRGRSDVTVLERGSQLGAESTAKNAAILRTLCEHPSTSMLARRGAAFLREPPPGFADVPLLESVGLLLVDESGDEGELARWVTATAGASGAETITLEQVRELAPHVRIDAGTVRHFPAEGRIDVAALVDGFARGARAAGIELRTDAPVAELLVEDGGVAGVVLEGGETLRAESVALAAGGWAGQLAATAGSRVRMTPRRRHLGCTTPDASIDPAWPAVWALESGFYCRPESGGMLICACDEDEGDPDESLVDADVGAELARKASAYLPGLENAGLAHLWCGMRTFSADERFAIGPDPDITGLFWIAGLGGHGISCGPAVGALAAARLVGAPPSELALEFDPARLVSAPA